MSFWLDQLKYICVGKIYIDSMKTNKNLIDTSVFVWGSEIHTHTHTQYLTVRDSFRPTQKQIEVRKTHR